MPASVRAALEHKRSINISLRCLLHRPPRRRVQQSLQNLLVELRVSRREMAARFIARQDEKEPAILQTLHRACHEALSGGLISSSVELIARTVAWIFSRSPEAPRALQGAHPLSGRELDLAKPLGCFSPGLGRTKR